jgi:hypothetical protein
MKLSELSIDGYQRLIRPRQIANIMRHFNPARLGVLVVNRREDGVIAVLDGHNRLSSLREMGYGAAHCIVLEGLTIEEEADFFRRQKENVSTLTQYNQYVAGVYARDPHYVTIHYLLNKYGFRASGRETGPRNITAISALSKITQTFGFPVLQQTLEWIAAAWPNDTAILRREMLAGLSDFASRFGNTIPTSLFASRMSAKHPGDMLHEYKRRLEGRTCGTSAFSPSVRFVMCGVLVDVYNKGLGSSSRYRMHLVWGNPAIQESESVNA